MKKVIIIAATLGFISGYLIGNRKKEIKYVQIEYPEFFKKENKFKKFFEKIKKKFPRLKKNYIVLQNN